MHINTAGLSVTGRRAGNARSAILSRHYAEYQSIPYLYLLLSRDLEWRLAEFGVKAKVEWSRCCFTGVVEDGEAFHVMVHNLLPGVEIIYPRR